MFNASAVVLATPSFILKPLTKQLIEVEAGCASCRKWIEETKEVGAEITAEYVDILVVDPSLAHYQNRLTIKPSHQSCYRGALGSEVNVGIEVSFEAFGAL